MKIAFSLPTLSFPPKKGPAYENLFAHRGMPFRQALRYGMKPIWHGGTALVSCQEAMEADFEFHIVQSVLG